MAVRVHGLDEKDAHQAINEAFEDIALIHRVMSFQELDSDVTRLNRDAADRAVVVHEATFEVLKCAEEMSQLSGGCFDITIAPQVVALGVLAAPDSRREPDPEATWRDVNLEPNCRVRFQRPLWIDLGGIAKGYAVDRALEILRARGAIQACVNAGGDLRIHGPDSERVLLTPGEFRGDSLPVLDVENAAVASSGSTQPHAAGDPCAPHFDGRSRQSTPGRRFVSVLARHCVTADALTKVVLTLEDQSEPILRQCGASAHLYDPARGWQHLAVWPG